MKKQPTVVRQEEARGLHWKKYGYLLAAAAFLLFANTLWNGYNLDDSLVTMNHPLTSQGLSAISEIFSQSYYSDEMGYAFGYRPMVLLSFALEHHFLGESAATSHFVNVLLFAVSVLLFFRFCMSLAGGKSLSFVVASALLFVVHPIHTEVVASIKNRDELLAWFFVLATGLSLSRFLRKKNFLFLLLGTGLFVLALLSKKSVYPMVVILPLSFVFLRRISRKDALLLTTALVLPGALIASEWLPGRLILMLLLPYGSVFLGFALLHLQGLSLRRLLSSLSSFVRSRAFSYVLMGVTWLLAGWAVYERSLLPYLFSLPLHFILFRKADGWVVPQFCAQLALLSVFLFLPDFMRIAVMVSVAYFFYSAPDRRKHVLVWLPPILLVGLSLFGSEFRIQPILFNALIVAFFFLLFRKAWWALGLIIAEGLVAFFFFNVGPFLWLALAIALAKLLSEHWENDSWHLYFLSGLFVVVLLFPLQRNRLFVQAPPAVPTASETLQETRQGTPALEFAQEEAGGLKEGRHLEFVENPLVASNRPDEKMATGWLVLGTYAKLMVFPLQLSFYYGYAQIEVVDFSSAFVWVSIFGHLLLFFLALLSFFRPHPSPYLKWITVGVLWYFLCIVLFSNWIELVAGIVGERLAFAASGGFCLVVAALFFWWKPQFSFRKPGVVEVLFLLVLVAFGLRTVLRNNDWRDEYTLMSHDVKHLGKSAQANFLYANTLMGRSMQPDQHPEKALRLRHAAVARYKRALEIDSTYFNAAYDLGRAALMIGDKRTAITGFQRAVSMGYEDFFDPYYQLSNLYLGSGDFQKLLPVAETIYRLEPGNVNAHYYLYKALEGVGARERAKEVLTRAMELFPGVPELQDEYRKNFL